MKEQLTFKNGKKDGLFTEWYKNGKKKKEVTYKNGELGGLWTQWYENGQKQVEKIYRNGIRWGIETIYFQNDVVKYKGVVYREKGNENYYITSTGYDENTGKLIESLGNWDNIKIKSGECYYKNELVDCSQDESLF